MKTYVRDVAKSVFHNISIGSFSILGGGGKAIEANFTIRGRGFAKRAYMHTRTRMYMHTRTRMFAHMHTHMHAYIHTHTS